MAKQVKDRTAKTAVELDFNEFVTWATAYILFGIGEGRRLRDLVRDIIDQAVRNKVFGGRAQTKTLR